MFDRRAVAAMLAGSAVAPHFALAQGGEEKSAFYSGVGNEPTHYDVGTYTQWWSGMVALA
jgi:hypothetical protein